MCYIRHVKFKYKLITRECFLDTQGIIFSSYVLVFFFYIKMLIIHIQGGVIIIIVNCVICNPFRKIDACTVEPL